MYFLTKRNFISFSYSLAIVTSIVKMVVEWKSQVAYNITEEKERGQDFPRTLDEKIRDMILQNWLVCYLLVSYVF